ncbi:hypothetical protein B0I35DRAFT_462021 [Stachybotrys elegans]|uniref:Zn(2)-C6 fungal-type domain-containing protein n=1 Tax=Stachybotrys elegans TaxID=80388 RepID=A0A8K0WPE3_9HYPO|nr:hypothetical protein B0I35DRAFT_462021 [Stachybotrys elegans]
MAEMMKRRKVRKGTHSCWECRRRKIRCKFGAEDDAVCMPCQARGVPCISQEFDSQQQQSAGVSKPSAPSSPDAVIAQRLVRLEQLVLGQPRSAEGAPDAFRGARTPLASQFGEEPDLFGLTAVRDARRLAGSATETCPMAFSKTVQAIPEPIPEASSSSPSTTRSSPSQPAWDRSRAVSFQLHALFPSEATLGIIAGETPGPDYVLSLFSSSLDKSEGNVEPRHVLAHPPPIDSHPALIGRRLLQLALCLQQLPPHVDESQLRLERPIRAVAAEWAAAVHDLVARQDELLACQEGIECLLLLSFYFSEGGQLRKAWMVTRRALNLAQLMGLDRASGGLLAPSRSMMLRSCDPTRRARPTAARLWFNINCSDRYHSLMLGLSIGSRDCSFATDAAMANESPLDRLSKLYSVISCHIAERNHDAVNASTDTAATHVYGLTQALDLDLDRAARLMNSVWWELPQVSAGCDDRNVVASLQLKIQTRHYLLMIMVHLPYLLRDGEGRRYEYNRLTCMQASRAVLARFLEFRSVFTEPVASRDVDYAALIAAMTLLLGYLRQVNRGPEKQAEMDRDRDLAVAVRDRMQSMATQSKEPDRLSSESADTITELLPILRPPSEHDVRDMQLNVPLLGTVNLNPHLETGGTCENPSLSVLVNDGMEQDHMMDYAPFPSCAEGMLPGEEEAFAMQGVDATYWSLVNAGSSW